MKNSLITLSISALIAAALLPVSIGLIASVTAVTGIMALAFGDVVRDIKPLTLSRVPAGSARLPFAA